MFYAFTHKLFFVLFCITLTPLTQACDGTQPTQPSSAPVPENVGGALEPADKALDLSTDIAIFDAFVNLEVPDTAIKAYERFTTDEEYRKRLVELSLGCRLYPLYAEDAQTLGYCRFQELPEQVRAGYRASFEKLHLAWLKMQLVEQNGTWHALTPRLLALTIAISYATGRQVRGAGWPTLDELYSRWTPLTIPGDILLGYLVNMLTTLCHECGHAAAYRVFYGKWPESVTIGTCNSNAPAIISLFGGKLALRGLNFSGATTYDGDGIDPREARSLSVFAAGGISGIAGYHLLKKAVYALQGKEYAWGTEFTGRYRSIEAGLITLLNQMHGLIGLTQNADSKKVQDLITQHPELVPLMLALLVDVSVWYELRNICFDYQSGRSDASYIAAALDAQFNRLYDAIAKKIKWWWSSKKRKNRNECTQTAEGQSKKD
ncbi:MAG: hypothetical protein M1549_04250 [Candidatus Dependentiae bacterium]|nr:hypothetical protein [Candidatus Dependentiae bacterium]